MTDSKKARLRVLFLGRYTSHLVFLFFYCRSPTNYSGVDLSRTQVQMLRGGIGSAWRYITAALL